MDKKSAERNISLYRLYVIFNEPLFWGPILIMSLQKLAHMPLPDIYFMEAAVLVICVALDMPSGALADIIGRRKTIIIGRCFLFGSTCLFAVMSRPLEAWIGNILWAIGYSMQSGADTALFYDTLKEAGKEREYKRIEGTAVGLRLALIACCSLAAGALAGINLRLPIYLSLPGALVPLVSSLFLREPTKTKRYSARQQLDVLKQGAAFAFRSPEIRWIIGFAALLAATSKVWFFAYNPYFEIVGIDIAHYGLIFFLLNVVAWLSSHYAHMIERHAGERGCVIGMILCVGVPILLMGLVPIRPFAYLVIAQNIARGFMRPFVGDYMNRHIATSARATVLSVQSSASHLTAIAGLAGFGLLAKHVSLLRSLIVLGMLALSLGALSYGSYQRRNRRTG